MIDKAIIDRCLVETYKHREMVRTNIEEFIKELLHRGECHDDSKLMEPELSGFAVNTEKLQSAEYGSQTYNDLLKELKPTIEHHYSKNRHHPESHKKGIDDMNLVDLIEMICDWKAGSARTKNGNIRQSLDVNALRYRMSPQLVSIFENTVRDFFKD